MPQSGDGGGVRVKGNGADAQRTCASYTVLYTTRLTNPNTHLEADRVVARSGVRVLGRDEMYGAYKGVSGAGAVNCVLLLR